MDTHLATATSTWRNDGARFCIEQVFWGSVGGCAKCNKISCGAKELWSLYALGLGRPELTVRAELDFPRNAICSARAPAAKNAKSAALTHLWIRAATAASAIRTTARKLITRPHPYTTANLSSSTMSKVNHLPERCVIAPPMVRSARPVRPALPIILPTSEGWTYNRSAIRSSLLMSSTFTSSG
jgi:hypothetical protein